MNVTTKNRIATLYPGVRPLVEAMIADMQRLTGKELIVTEAMRSHSVQRVKYLIGRKYENGKWFVENAGRIVTHAMPGMSYHQYGLAVDFAFRGEDPYLNGLPPLGRNILWNTVGQVAKENGLAWGGEFKKITDKPHCEKTYGLKVSALMELHEHGGLKAVWTYLDKICGVIPGTGWGLEL